MFINTHNYNKNNNMEKNIFTAPFLIEESIIKELELVKPRLATFQHCLISLQSFHAQQCFDLIEFMFVNLCVTLGSAAELHRCGATTTSLGTLNPATILQSVKICKLKENSRSKGACLEK